MRSVAQLSTSTLLAPYLALSSGQSAATTMIASMNQVLPRLYSMGDWLPLQARVTFDVSAGYACLAPDFESILGATLNESPVTIQSMTFEFKKVGLLGTGVSHIYGLIDMGMQPTMSDPPTGGIDELIFTCSSAAFAAGATTSITSAATYASGTQTNLLVSSSTGFAVGDQITISGASAGVEDYNAGWRITAVPDSTHIAINKVFTATLTGTVTSPGDTATITYTDTDEDVGYAQVVLPLYPTAITISSVVDGGIDATTLEELTDLTVSSTTGLGLVVGMGITVTPADPVGDATYSGTFRVHSLPDNLSIIIVKTWVAGAMSGTAVNANRLMPVSTIASIESLEFSSLPGRVLVKDADGIIYAILTGADGVAEFRRYECPQVPDTVAAGDTWEVLALCKRRFIPLTSTADFVRIDSLAALKHGMLAVIAEDNADLDRAERHWKAAVKILDSELYDTKGGVEDMPTVEIWGRGVPGIPSTY